MIGPPAPVNSMDSVRTAVFSELVGWFWRFHVRLHIS